jgi:hypothetical protein
MEIATEMSDPPKRRPGEKKYRPRPLSEAKREAEQGSAVVRAEARTQAAKRAAEAAERAAVAAKTAPIFAQGERDPATGRFLKGCTGNPGGKTKADRRVVADLAAEIRTHADVLIDGLIDLAKNSPMDNVRLGAINSLLDRGFGKAVQSVDLRADVQSVNLNVYQDLPADDQRLAAEVLGAITSNPSALSLAVDIMAEPDIVLAPFADDQVIEAEVVEVTPVRAGTHDQGGEIIDLVAEPAQE